MVGDPAQTIYTFAGANADYLRQFPAKFANTTSIELVRNYRSTPQIIEGANKLLAGSTSQSVRLQSQRPPGAEVSHAGRPDEVAEAAMVAQRIGELRDQGRALSEVAVLFRINAQSEAYEEALTDRGIPYVIRGAKRFFDRPEVREAITRVRGAARSGEGGRTGDELADVVRDTLAGMGWTPDPPTSRGQTRDRWESWQALVSQAEAFASTPASPASSGSSAADVPDLDAFVDDIDRRASEQHAPTAEGVTLSTFHSAKGLEWDSVFLVGLQDGTVPLVYADTPAAIEEERRLLYVGMTRARVDLALSWALARNPGQAPRRKPSRFLTPLLPASEVASNEASGASRRSRKAAHCRECGKPLTGPAQKKIGRCTDCPASYDEALYEQLRAWRKQRAADEEKPAFVIFTDATLQLIAEHRPVTPHGLMKISGIGSAKLERYGDDLLDLLEAAVEASP